MPSAPFGAVRTPAGQTPFVATGPTVAAPVGPAMTRQSNAETAMDHPMLKPRNLFRHPQQR
jgi:hypothetical protein